MRTNPARINCGRTDAAKQVAGAAVRIVPNNFAFAA